MKDLEGDALDLFARTVPLARNERWALFEGDCGVMLSEFEPNSIDALVTDPPAGIGFMGKSWDSNKGGRDRWIAWLAAISRQILRVMKPGAFGFVWALPRTSHWTATGLENGGFEIRDINHHLFGTGFPKGTDKTRIPAEWAGWNTALKPAAEHWILVRKPPIGTLAENLKAHQVGTLNVDGCRIGVDTRKPRSQKTPGVNYEAGTLAGSELGRWPANVTLSESGAAALDEQTADLRVGGRLKGSEGRNRSDVSPLDLGPRGKWEPYGDSGGASRFFYVAKPGRKERDDGCDHLPAKTGGEATDRAEGSAGMGPRSGAGRGGGSRNFHPTVKPQALMRWLVRLITPPGGTVLDPFTGSGSTGVAALSEGVRFLGIELSGEYSTIARARIEHAAKETL